MPANDNDRVNLGASVNAFVGARIRARRDELKLTPAELAKRLHIFAENLCQFESGNRRVSASLLYDMSQVLSVPIAFFFQGYVVAG